MVGNGNSLEKRLRDAADEQRAYSKLKTLVYPTPVLGLILLQYADHKFTVVEREQRANRQVTCVEPSGKTDY